MNRETAHHCFGVVAQTCDGQNFVSFLFHSDEVLIEVCAAATKDC